MTTEPKALSLRPIDMDVTSRRRFLTLLAAAAAVSACGAESTTGPTLPPPTTVPPATPTPNLGDIATISHSYERLTPTGNGASAVAGDQQLAADLFGLIGADSNDNFMFSPYSIATAFSMLLAGARGTTADQIAEALGASDEEWHAVRNALDVAVRTPSYEVEGAEPLELEIANTPYGQTGFPFEDDYIRTLAEQYGAELRSLDFVANPEAARALINAAIAEDTRDRITDLLPEGSIDAMARLVLVNTVFFKGTWRNEFNAASTSDRAFTRLDGSTVPVPTMQGSVRTTYVRDSDWQMVKLPYFGGYSMIVVVPNEGSFDDVAAGFDAEFMTELVEIRSDYMVALDFPKFDFKSEADLKPLFQTLGVTDAFDENSADLSGIEASQQLFVSGAFHQATIEVDEVGTTATAATAMIVSATSAPEPVALRIDRPFIFMITQDDSGEPLFVGRVTDPSA